MGDYAERRWRREGWSCQRQLMRRHAGGAVSGKGDLVSRGVPNEDLWAAMEAGLAEQPVTSIPLLG